MAWFEINKGGEDERVGISGREEMAMFDSGKDARSGKAGEEDGGETAVPLSRLNERLTKKRFSQFITRENSPVQPERFPGYHTGIDLEVFEDEFEKEVEIRVICSGRLVLSSFISGYGGVAVESCERDGQEMTVVYGHLDRSKMKYEAGEEVKKGAVLGVLGDDKSSETDYERKHLHLGIYKGSEINLKGYVNSKQELNSWIDPCLVLGCE